MKHLAVIREYEELRQALCARRDQLNVTHGTLDELSGLQAGYVSKVLAPKPIKHLGPTSLGPLMGALGVTLLMVEDTAQMERIRARLLKRRRIGRYAQLVNSELQAAASILGVGVILTSERGREYARKRVSKQTEFRRKSVARKAARARWKKVWTKPHIREVGE